MRRSGLKKYDAPKEWRFADEVGEPTEKWNIAVVMFDNDGVVQAVTFAYLIYW